MKRRYILATATALGLALSTPASAIDLGFGPGRATLSMQIVQQGELALQTANQLKQIEHEIQMLMQLDVNNSSQITAALQRVQGMLGQVDKTLPYDANAVVGAIGDRYPLERGTLTIEEFTIIGNEWLEAEQAALIESHKTSSQIIEDMPDNADRDATILDEQTEGIVDTLQAGNQLTAATNNELRQQTAAIIAANRADEAERLARNADMARRKALSCASVSPTAKRWVGSTCP